jgi:predicted negative regulator of RcsB-dependent stress response
MKEIFESNGFWTVIGIIIGSLLNTIVWILQEKSRQKEYIKIKRLEKLEEIADFFNVLDERIKTASVKTINEGGSRYWAKNPDFWINVPFIKIRVIMQAYFPESIKDYDQVQLEVKKYMEYIKEINTSEQYSIENIECLKNEITKSRDNLILTMGKKYIKKSL